MENKYTQGIVILSLISILGSLYFSEVKLYVPCELCWYQRILMYPILPISLVGFILKDKYLGYYTVVLSGIGMGVSSYHYTIQKVALLGDNIACTGGVPCTVEYVNYLGFITIPLMCLVSFIGIFTLSILSIKKERENVDGK